MYQWATVVVLVLVACNGTPRATADASCNTPDRPEADWKSDSGSAFRFVIPPEFRRVARRGVDSEVGWWESQSGEIFYDYGAYSNPLNDSPYSSGHMCIVQVGQRGARLVQYRKPNGDFAVAGHWQGFGDAGLGPVALTVMGSSRDSAAAAKLWRSLWSVTFRH